MRALLTAIGLTSLIALPPLAQGRMPDHYTAAAYITTIAWLAAAIFALASFFGIPGPRGCLPVKWKTTLTAVYVELVVAAVGLAGIAYARGPDPGKVYMAFGGSPIVSGTAAAIIAGLGLMLFDWRRALVPVSCATYLAFVGTARTTVLVALAVVGGISFADALGRWGRTAALAATKRFALSLGTVGMCLVLVAVPARMWTFYPFLSSRPGQVICAETRPDCCFDTKEYFFLHFRRWDRLARAILPRLGASVPREETCLLSLAPQAETRINLIIKSVQAIASRPLGWWPRRFDEIVPVECGVPGISQYLCGYPHNLVLEIGFYFGWLPLAIMAAGLLAWAIQVVRQLGPNSVTPVRISGVAFLAWLTFAMVSGNLVDHLIPLLLGGIWIALRWMVVEEAGSQHAG
jgi:hypothetical protein